MIHPSPLKEAASLDGQSSLLQPMGSPAPLGALISMDLVDERVPLERHQGDKVYNTTLVLNPEGGIAPWAKDLKKNPCDPCDVFTFGAPCGLVQVGLWRLLWPC